MKRIIACILIVFSLCMLSCGCSKKTTEEQPSLSIYYYDVVGMLMSEKHIIINEGDTAEQILKANYVNVQVNDGRLVMFEDHNTLATEAYTLVVKYNDVKYVKLSDFAPENGGVLIIKAELI